MSDSFNDLPWHDATLLAIEVDRRRPGHGDQIRLLVQWPNGSFSEILFSDCYAAEASLRFGVVAAETIRWAQDLADDPQLVALRDQWARLGVELRDVKCFALETNATASRVRIYARQWAEIQRPGT